MFLVFQTMLQTMLVFQTKFLLKLTKECVFSVNNRLIKKIDGCPMGGPISIVFSDIYVCKMEEDIVTPMKPHFHKRYVRDTHIRRKKNEPDSLFEKLNSYHPNIKLSIERNLTKFLDTEIIRRECEIETKVYSKSQKLPDKNVMPKQVNCMELKV